MNQIFTDILTAHFGNIPQQLSSLSVRERPLDPPEDKNDPEYNPYAEKVSENNAAV